MIKKIFYDDIEFKSDVYIVFYGYCFNNGLSNLKYDETYTILKNEGSLKNEIIHLNLMNDGLERVIFAPLNEIMTLDEWRDNISKIANICLDKKYRNINVSFDNFSTKPINIDELSRLLTEIFILSNYRFDKLLKTKEKQEECSINIIIDERLKSIISLALNEGVTLGKSTSIVRDLVNMPSNKQSPIQFLKEVKSIFNNAKVKVKCLYKPEIESMNMKGFLKVSQGSENEPVLIVLEYQTDLSKPLIGVIGKGITYDSGGLSLKSKNRMITMHHDMAGAASVVGAFHALEKQGGLQNIVAVLPVCENLIAKDGYRPGDIIEMMNGETVMIKSTDAEGRLVIADAIHYAIQIAKVDELIDIASLTGGARLAYGPVASAYAINEHSEAIKEELIKASEKAGEKIWEMPLFDEYLEMLQTPHADIANTGNGSKMIGGALFIKNFVDNLPWIHIDIAGTCWSDIQKKYYSYGATGVGCRLIYHFLKE